MSDDSGRGSMNEAVYVEADDQKIYFRPLNMQSRSSEKSKLSHEGAAEFFWDLFFSPIKAGS